MTMLRLVLEVESTPGLVSGLEFRAQLSTDL